MLRLGALIACSLVIASPPRSERVWQPPSAHSALVRVVEAAVALDSDAARIEIHGATSVYHPPRDAQRETVRVSLDALVIAADDDTAAEHAARIRTALADQPWIVAEDSRVEQVAYPRVQRVYHALSWIQDEPAQDGSVRRPHTIAVDVDPRGFLPEFAEIGDESADGAQATVTQGEVELYIRRAATDDKVTIGRVAITRRQRVSVAGTEDLIYEIEPPREARFTRGMIGNFLYLLESESDRVQITAIELEPFAKGSDEWTFAIDLTLRRPTE